MPHIVIGFSKIEPIRMWGFVCSKSMDRIIYKRKPMSEETKMKISKANKNRKPYIMTEEIKEKLSKAMKGNTNCLGNKHSEESKMKISIARIGKPSGMLGKKHTKDTKIKIGIAGIGNKYSLGFKHSNETKKKMSEARKGEKNHFWKGENVGYIGLHKWIRRELGNANVCKFCGKKKTTPKSIHWSNKDHTYKRNLTDWTPLCPSCHKKYDLKNN